MPHYKDLNNNVHWLDDAAFEHILPAGSVQITDEEADALRPPPAVDYSSQIRAVLDSVGCFNIAHFKKDWALLESERIREAKTQAQAYAENKVYKMFVDSAAQLTTYGVQL